MCCISVVYNSGGHTDAASGAVHQGPHTSGVTSGTRQNVLRHRNKLSSAVKLSLTNFGPTDTSCTKTYSAVQLLLV